MEKKMKKMRSFKLILDVFMAVVVVTLFSKIFLGIQYHEIAGLAVLIPILDCDWEKEESSSVDTRKWRE